MLKLLALDRFTILLIAMVVLATFFPVSGQVAHYFNMLTTVAIAILFFLHGAKLSREAVVQGMLHWKMHALVFAFTFAIFPVIGLLAKPVLEPLLGQQLYWASYLCASYPQQYNLQLHLRRLQKGMLQERFVVHLSPISLGCLLRQS